MVTRIKPFKPAKITLSVIIPVYNEKQTILEVISRVKESGQAAEIIIVDDFSTDGTREILQGLKEKNIIIKYHGKNQGKGAAIKTALQSVNGDYVVIQDADLEYDPHDYAKLLGPIERGKAEVVYGSRFTGEHRNLLFWHWVCNQLINFITNLLFNTTISDVETGYKVFKTSILKDISWKAQSFDFEIEITAKILKKHIYIYEVPISYAGRDYAQGKKITFTDGLIALWSIFKYRFVD